MSESPLDYFSKLDSQGQNPNGFVENFKLPRPIKVEMMINPDYKKLLDEHEKKIKDREDEKSLITGDPISLDKYRIVDQTIENIPPIVLSTWKSQMSTLEKKQRKLNETLNSNVDAYSVILKRDRVLDLKNEKKSNQEKIKKMFNHSNREVMMTKF